jgi:CheY-like chemotaxis protein
MNILIAEDDAVSRLFLQTLLERMGHSVKACEDGSDAWGAYKHGDYRIIISDWIMPRMDGLDLCRAVRKLDRQPRCYFIVATARSLDLDPREALAAGANACINKPIHRDDIEGRLKIAQKLNDPYSGESV